MSQYSRHSRCLMHCHCISVPTHVMTLRPLQQAVCAFDTSFCHLHLLCNVSAISFSPTFRRITEHLKNRASVERKRSRCSSDKQQPWLLTSLPYDQQCSMKSHHPRSTSTVRCLHPCSLSHHPFSMS